jgi:hypothetical protein
LTTAGAQVGAKGLDLGTDPHTRGDSAAIERAGYAGIGPMDWSRTHDTGAIESLLGQRPFAWIETEHFRIGSTLPALHVDGAARKRVRVELGRMRNRLPSVRPASRDLDRWLRAHLTAQRCEEQWRDFESRFGSPDWDAPKVLVLLLEHDADLARYTQKYLGRRLDGPRRFELDDRVMFVGAAADTAGLGDETGMHSALAYHIAVALVDLWGTGKHRVPAWLTCGVGNWYGRQVDPACGSFEEVDHATPDARRESDSRWRVRVRRLVLNGGAPSLATLFEHRDVAAFKHHDYLVSWSLVEFLLSRKGDGASEFMYRMKEPLWRRGDIPAQGMLERQRDALEAVWGYDAESFAVDWRKHVLRRYRS